MVKWKFGVPIIGAIITFISMATHAITSSILTADGVPAPFAVNMWLTGNLAFGSYIGLVSEIYALSGGMIAIDIAPFIVGFAGVLIGAILAVASGVLGLRGNYRKSIALLGGVLMLAFSLIFAIWVESSWSLFSGKTYDYMGFTIYYKFGVGFGIIGPIIGGIIGVASFFLDRIPEKERKIQEAPPQPPITTQPPVTTQPQIIPTEDVRKCRHCGSVVPGDFCPSCGKPFQPLIAQ